MDAGVSARELVTWLVVCHLALVSLCMIGFALFILKIRRHQRPTPEQQLIDEVARELEAAQSAPTPKLKPWERPADWWKEV